jgi:hypothetical protein
LAGGVITDSDEREELHPVFEVALGHIEAIGGDALFGAAKHGQLPFGQGPQGRTELFASASGQLFQIEEHKKTAIPFAYHTAEEFAAAL